MTAPVTALDMYNFTLQLLNKFNNSSIDNEEFNILVNWVQMQHVLNVYKQYELGEGQIDTLSPIILYALIPNTGGAVAGQEKFDLPFMTVPAAGNKYSRGFLRALNVAVKLFYKNDKCVADGLGTKYERVFLKYDDEETVVSENPFRSAEKTKLMYYQRTENYYSIETGSQNYAAEMRLRYLRYPREIDLAQSSGIGDCELPLDTRKEICSLTAKTCIELIESGRYPTFLNEVQTNANP